MQGPGRERGHDRGGRWAHTVLRGTQDVRTSLENNSQGLIRNIACGECCLPLHLRGCPVVFTLTRRGGAGVRTAMLCILQVPALVSPPVSTRQLAAELSQYGLTVLKEPQLDQAQLEQVRQRCSARLSALLDELQVQGGDPIEQHYTFAEIAHRQRLRWDLRLPDEDPLWQCACDAALAAAMPVVEQLHPPHTAAAPRTLMSGVLISRSVVRAERMTPLQCMGAS